MRFWKKRLQRVAAMVCSVALVASMMPTAVFATESQATTPTPEPTSIVETTPTPEPSESPENTDATVTTSAPDTGTGSTSAPEATTAGNTDGTKEPEESPEPSEEPTDDTTESGEESTETTDSTTVPSEENVEQQVSVPQTLAAAPAAAPETRARWEETLYDENGVRFWLYKDAVSAYPYTVSYEVWFEGEKVKTGSISGVPMAAIYYDVTDGYDVSLTSPDSSITFGADLTIWEDNAKLVVSLAKEKQQDTITIEDESSDAVYGTFQWVKGTAVESAFLRTITIRVNGEEKWSQKVATPLTLSGGGANPEYDFTPNLSKYNSEVEFDREEYNSATWQDITIDLTTKCLCGQLGCQCEGGASCKCEQGCDCEKCQPKDENVIITEYGTIRYMPQDDDDVTNNRTVQVELYVNGNKAKTSVNIPALKLDSSRTGALTFEPSQGYYFHHNDDGSLNGYDLDSPFDIAPSWQPETGFLTITGDSATNPGHATEVNTLRIYLWTFKNSVAINVDSNDAEASEHVNNYTLSFTAINPQTGKEEQYTYPATSWDATQLQLVPFGSHVTLTADCDPYYEVDEWYMDGAPQVTYLDGEEGRSTSIGELGTDQHAYGNTAYLDILGNVSQVLVRIYGVRTVTPPSDDEMQKLLGNAAVKVSCDTKPTEHFAEQYALKSDSYETASQMGGNSVVNYTYTITVKPDDYVEEYNLTYPDHSDANPATREIVFEYVAGKWEVQTKTPVTFNVTCEDSKIPDVDVDELGDKVVTIQCINTATSHPEMKSAILGDLNTDYRVDYGADKKTATIKIISADKYVEAYNTEHGKPEHTAASQISDATIKVNYDETAKKWVIDSSDNTATVDVTCEDTAVTSVDLEKTITQVKRGNEVFAGQNIPQMLKVGDEITYQINVTNTGDVNLEGLTVTDAFTGNNKPSEGDGITWTGAAGNWTGTISNIELPAGEAKTYKYTCTVAEEDKGKTISNKATINGDDSEDPTDEDEIKTEVENPAVGVEKSLVQVKRGEEIFLAEKGTIPEELEVGDELTYEIEVKNIGNVKLNGLTLTDTFNGHFAPSKVKDKVANAELTNKWEKDTTTGLWTLTIKGISPEVGEIETYTYTYTVNQADAGKNLTNTAAVTGGGTDPDDSKDDDTRPVKDDGDITLRPADITIYKGGESGSTSVVEDENGTIAEENNSLPTPGFYFDLPDAVNEAVSTYYGVPSAEAVDLSRFITITAKAEDGSDRVWRLEKYGEGETSFTTIDGQEHYIYKLVAGDGQDPVRVQFTDDQGNFVTSDDFTLEDAMCETYTMQIYTGSVDTSTLTIKVEIPQKDDVPAQTFHCGYGATQTATLTVRHVNGEQEEVVTDAVTAITDVAQENTPLENAYVVADSDAVFNVNDSSVSVNQNSVSLLFDDLTTDAAGTNKAVERLLAIAEENSGLTGTIEQQAKYLNLVDADNGNAWLTAEGDVTIYWPYPEGTDKNTKFSLLHFDGIDREKAIGDLVSEVEGVTPEPMTITTDDYGIFFTTKTFSPFVLMWETEQPSGGEDKPSGGDDGNNNNNNNNTNTNNQTTTVNVANQAAAPAAAPAAVSVPQTSDDMPIGALTAAAVAAAAALVGLLVVRKRRQK